MKLYELDFTDVESENFTLAITDWIRRFHNPCYISEANSSFTTYKKGKSSPKVNDIFHMVNNRSNLVNRKNMFFKRRSM